MSENMVGLKFKLRVPMLGNPAGTTGIVFNQYQDFDYSDELGIQVIFPNGQYDGFSFLEQLSFLNPAGFDEKYFGYKFTNVMQVAKDFRNGYWKF